MGDVVQFPSPRQRIERQGTMADWFNALPPPSVAPTASQRHVMDLVSFICSLRISEMPPKSPLTIALDEVSKFDGDSA